MEWENSLIKMQLVINSSSFYRKIELRTVPKVKNKILGYEI